MINISIVLPLQGFLKLLRLDLVVERWSRSTKLHVRRVWFYTGMRDRLPAGKLPRFVPSHSVKLSLLPSAGRKMNTSQSAVIDALRLWSKIHVWFHSTPPSTCAMVKRQLIGRMLHYAEPEQKQAII